MSGVVAANKPPATEENDDGDDCCHRYLILWSSTWHCCDCKLEIKDSERVSREEAFANAAETEDKERGVAPAVYSHQMGVTVDWLVKWTEAQQCWNFPTWKVQHTIIKPLTELQRCRFTELEPSDENKLDGVVGPADIFVSHCWGSCFGDLVAALADCCDGSQRAWVDIFAVRQWPGNGADLDFAGVVSRCACVVLVCVRLEIIEKLTWFEIQEMAGKIDVPSAARKSIPFFRVWCLVELQAALSSGIPVIMQGGCRDRDLNWPNIIFTPSYDMLSKLEALVSVEHADATIAEDKRRILAEVRATPGGAAKLNKSVQAAIYAARIGHKYKIVTRAAIGRKEALQSIKEYCSSVNKGNAKENVNHLIVAAAAGGYETVFDSLLIAGAEIDPQNEDDLPHFCYTNKYDDDGGETETITSLMAASRAGKLDMVKKIVELGVDVNRKNTRGKTALQFAAARGHTEIAQVLLSFGADIESSDHIVGRAALAVAAGNLYNTSCIELLCSVGKANIDAIDFAGRTALDHALIRNVKDSVCLLLKLRDDAKLPVADKTGRTTLFHAVRYADYEIVAELLKYGADPNVALPDGTTPLMIAVEADGIGKGRENIVSLLLQAGAKLDTEDEDGETAQSLAELWENATLIDLFKKDTLLS